MAETITTAPVLENNDEIWEFLDRVSRPVGGGSDEDMWAELGVPEGERAGLGERFKGAVDGVGRFLQKIHLPRLGREPAGAAEPAEAGRNRFFGWLGKQNRRFDEWRKKPFLGERAEAAAAVVAEAPEGEADRFGWLKNGWKYVSGLPGGLVGKFRRQGETAAAAPQISSAERVKAIKDGTRQFVEQHWFDLVVGLFGLAGAGVGAAVVSPENVGILNALGMEISAVSVAGVSALGLIIGESQGPESIPDAEKAYQRPIRALQRFCSQIAVRRGLSLVAASSAGVAIGGMGRMVFDVLQVVQQGTAATPEAAEMATGNLANVWSPEPGAATDWAARQQELQQLAQSVGQPGQVEPSSVDEMVRQAVTAVNQVDTTLSHISDNLTGNSQVQPLVESASQARVAVADYYNQAVASGGVVDATEAARIKELASQAQQAANQALEAARQLAQQNAQAVAGAADAEAMRQGVLQGGSAMKDVIGATPSGTPFEALQQVAFRHTGSPYASEVANALSWALPRGDTVGLTSGAIGEGAKKVAELLQQAHDFAAANGGEYTVHAIRQAVNDGRLSQDVLRAVEAANLPAGEGKTQAIQGLNTILQGVIK